MTTLKKPKQKSNYPGMLANFEKQRVGGWVKPTQKIRSNYSTRASFTPMTRKVPT